MTATDNVIEIPPTRLQQHPVRRRVRGELLDSLNHIEWAETATEELRLHPPNMASCAGSAPPETASTTWNRRFAACGPPTPCYSWPSANRHQSGDLV